ncbi:MAG: hypothetical protein AAF721_29340 [Myxococcota bacterium]
MSEPYLVYTRDLGGLLPLGVPQLRACVRRNGGVTIRTTGDASGETAEVGHYVGEAEPREVDALWRQFEDASLRTHDPGALDPEQPTIVVGFGAGDEPPQWLTVLDARLEPGPVADACAAVEATLRPVIEHAVHAVAGRVQWSPPVVRAGAPLAMHLWLTNRGTESTELPHPGCGSNHARLELSLASRADPTLRSSSVLGATDVVQYGPDRTPLPYAETIVVPPRASLAFAIRRAAFVAPGTYDGALAFRFLPVDGSDAALGGHLEMPVGPLEITA